LVNSGTKRFLVASTLCALIWSPPIFLIIFPLTEKALACLSLLPHPPEKTLSWLYVFAPQKEREAKAQWEVGTSFKSRTRTSYILLMRLAPSTLTCLRPFHATLHLSFFLSFLILVFLSFFEF
jgi:hypothetical protein